MASYSTVSQVQTHLGRAIGAGSLSRVAELIAEATVYVDGELGRTWQSVEEERNIECNGEEILEIPAVQSIASIVIHETDGTTDNLVEGDDWLARPGGAGNGVSPATVRQLQRYGCRWPSPPAYLRVDAVWCDGATVPSEIAQATALIAAAWCRAQGIGAASASDVKSESWDGYTVNYAGPPGGSSARDVPPEAERILARWRDQGSDSTFAVGV